jgi:hypothetical protein
MNFKEDSRIAAYIISEAVSDPAPVTNMKVIDQQGLFYLRFDTHLQDFNVLNRNKRMYMGSAMVPSLNAEHIMELQGKKSWFGEAGHPDSNDPKRILTIDPKLISHRIVSHNATHQGCSGTIETLDTKHGREMTKLILQHMEPAFSLRALAPLIKKGDGTSVIQAKAHVVTYDWVILPSHKTAYRDESKPIQKVIQQISDDGNVVTTEATLTPLQESVINDIVLTESFNVNVISNVCEVALGNAHVSKDLKNMIIKEGSDTYIVPIEESVKNTVADYMRNLF